jgi:uncharacterized protein
VTNQVNTQPVLTFDGRDDYVNFGKNYLGGVFAKGSSTFTVSGWVNPHQLTDQATSYGTHNVFFARSSDRYSDNFEFGISEEGNLDIYIDDNTDNAIQTFGNGELTIGQWHFFAIIFNAGQLNIYLDEHEYTGELTGKSLNKATSPVTLGATLHNNVYFTGQLANISVWNYPCTQTEIQTHRSSLLVGDEPGLVAYWRLNEGQGATVRDGSSNTCNGTLYGDPHWDLVQVPWAILASVDRPDEIASSVPPETAEIAQIRESPVPNGIPEPEPVQTLAQAESKTTMSATSNPKYKILAIDGGGIRGIIPATILAEIEKRTQKQIFSLFDLIAGSSSGGILALGLTKPRLDVAADLPPVAQYSAAELLQIYLEYGAEMFYEPLWEQILGRLENIFTQPKYTSEGRAEIIRQYFGDAPLENNLKEVLVTSYDIEQRIPVFFTNKLEKQQTESKKFRKLCRGFSLADAALATSATPTYFAPYRVASSHHPNGFYTLVDGGVVANNPANLAMTEAQINRQAQQQVLNPADVLLVSLGTGAMTSIYPYEEVKKWGLFQWSKPLLNILLDGGSEVIAGELERLFAAIDQGNRTAYYRFQTFLKSEFETIDNARPENLRQLQISANKLIQSKSQEIDELCTLLLN